MLFLKQESPPLSFSIDTYRQEENIVVNRYTNPSYHHYVRPNNELPSPNRSFFAGYMVNVRASNAFAALILIGCGGGVIQR